MLSMPKLALWAVLAALLVPLAAPARAEDYGVWPWRYGNWGGGGYSNGADGGDVWGSTAPVDALDQIFRDHDRGYARADADYRLAYRNVFKAAASAQRKKNPRWSDAKVRSKARDEKDVSRLWKKWKTAYEKADTAAVQAAKGLAEFPAGVNPTTGKAVKGRKWSEFRGRQQPTDAVRAVKRKQFLAVGDTWLMNDPPREDVEDEVLAQLRML